jgi:hypothetical protein
MRGEPEIWEMIVAMRVVCLEELKELEELEGS